MRTSPILLYILCAVLLWTCQNIEDAAPSKRKTFLHLFEGPYSIVANDMEIVNGEYIIVGEMSVPPSGNAVDSVVTVVFSVDNKGNRIGDFRYYQGSRGKSIVHHPDGGYIIVGDSIKRNLDPPNVANGLVSSAFGLLLNDAFDSVYSIRRTDVQHDTIPKTDYYCSAVTLDDDDNIIVLGTYVLGSSPTQVGVPERPFLASYAKNGDALTLNWTQDYDLIDRSYQNARSVHTRNNTIIWASGVARTVGDVTVSYVDIPVAEENSVFVNSSKIGETENQLFLPKDIQPAKNNAFGYGVVGSYSEPNATDGSKSNIFFMRVNAAGTIIEESVRFFDGIISKETGAELDDNTESSIIDEGQAIAATFDGGFVLAGTIESIPGTGNGGKDIILIKVNAFNDLVWIRTLGGSGDEVVSSIKETPDKGLLICGTNALSGASSVFLIKTDKNGELKN
jgi:hypothetical protein